MKRSPDMSDTEWEAVMRDRKVIAEQRMNAADSFMTQAEIGKASLKWYGKTDRDSLCLAENRLQRGERPE